MLSFSQALTGNVEMVLFIQGGYESAWIGIINNREG